MSSSTILTRRRFIAGTAGLAASAALGRRSFAQANKRLNIAVVGALGKGASDTKNVAGDHNIVALVDVDSARLMQASGQLAKFYDEKGGPAPTPPKLFTDFRKMLDEMGAQVDGVIVSTPDHTHYTAAMWAVKNKKHVCVQKPLCNTINEVRQLHRAAKEAGVITQMGNQGRTMEGQRLAKEWIEQGAIGKLKEVRLWTNRPIWPQGLLAKKPAACPESLDWNLWLAQETEESYFEFEPPADYTGRKSNAVHPFAWRGWWQFGCGALGDMGCHIMDATFSILGQRVPSRVEVQSSPITELTAPMWTNLVYHFAATATQPAITVSWNDGSRDGKPNKPQRDERVPEAAFNRASSGMMFIGTEGVVFEGEAYCNRPVIYPDERFAETKAAMDSGKVKKTEARSPQPGNPQLEWAHCIVNGGKPSSNFDYAAPLCEFVLLGNLAVRAGQTIEWDAAKGAVANVPEANKYLKRPVYRSGWL
jgi:predicted dehydrogenase